MLVEDANNRAVAIPKTRSIFFTVDSSNVKLISSLSLVVGSAICREIGCELHFRKLEQDEVP